jgi:tetratricopeptide (TPR) repeat protein
MKPQVRVVALLTAAAGVALLIGIGIRNSSVESQAESVNASHEVVPAAEMPATDNAGSNPGSNATTSLTAVLTPTEVSSHVRRARRALEQGDVVNAESLLTRVVMTSPTAPAWNVMGRVQLALSQPDVALEAFTQACALDSNYAWARNNLGWMHLQEGAWQAALPLLEQAVLLDDTVAVFHNNLAVAYERAHRYEDAVKAYARAIDLAPDHATASEALARVQAAQAQAEQHAERD